MSDKLPAQILDAEHGGLDEAAARLRAGQLVAIPTETVYGLAARADSEAAVAEIYRAKGRPSFNPLIVHVPDIDAAAALAAFDSRAQLLAEHFWPGPLTLVCHARARSPIVPAVTAGLPTIALRSPAHPLARALLSNVALPLAAPSANHSNGISPTRPGHVAASLGEACPPILDGGVCEQGLESTIVALRPEVGWQILRPGPIAQDALEDLLGEPPMADGGGRIEAPGQLARHYSPGKPIRLNAQSAQPGEFHIGFGQIAGDMSLSPSGDLAQAAARLYACLHEAAASSSATIAIAPIPGSGIGAAIADRLARAAAN